MRTAAVEKFIWMPPYVVPIHLARAKLTYHPLSCSGKAYIVAGWLPSTARNGAIVECSLQWFVPVGARSVRNTPQASQPPPTMHLRFNISDWQAASRRVGFTGA
jgi:hypothetical protein